MQRNNHWVIAIIFGVIFLTLVSLLFLHDDKFWHHHYLPSYRLPPITPLSPQQLNQKKPSIKRVDELVHTQWYTENLRHSVLSAWKIQATDTTFKNKAQALQDQLQALGLDAFIFSFFHAPSWHYMVYAGPWLERQDAERAMNLIQESLKITGIMQQYNLEATD